MLNDLSSLSALDCLTVAILTGRCLLMQSCGWDKYLMSLHQSSLVLFGLFNVFMDLFFMEWVSIFLSLVILAELSVTSEI